MQTCSTDQTQQPGTACTPDDLRRVAEHLQLLNERKDRFISVLAHELRTPLAPIANAVDALTMAANQSDMVPQACGIIRRQMYLLNRLVDDLFDITRIARGSIELRKDPVDLALVIQGSVESVRTLIESQGLKLTISLPEEPLVLHADAARLAQVFTNLLHNAAKFTDAGGSVSVTVERAEDAAVIRVRDSGIGISADAMPFIFELFTRAEPESRVPAGGLGIGLAVARQLVELHAGSITVSSDGPGRGSEFVVRLPLMQSQG